MRLQLVHMPPQQCRETKEKEENRPIFKAVSSAPLYFSVLYSICRLLQGRPPLQATTIGGICVGGEREGKTKKEGGRRSSIERRRVNQPLMVVYCVSVSVIQVNDSSQQRSNFSWHGAVNVKFESFERLSGNEFVEACDIGLDRYVECIGVRRGGIFLGEVTRLFSTVKELAVEM